MIETHPFGSFIPPKARYLVLGSFTTKEAYDRNFDYHWFYSNKRNRFWPILEAVYRTRLPTRQAKIELFTKLRIALADIIYQCERLDNSNLDSKLKNIVYAVDDITSILTQNRIATIYFTSRFVEAKFQKLFGKMKIVNRRNVKLVTLPSPSPRYVKLTIQQKIAVYRRLLPRHTSKS